MSRLCLIAGCRRPHQAKGLCGAHYMRVRQYGRLERVADWARTDYLRFWKYVLLEDVLAGGCWLWRGSIEPKGYPMLSCSERGRRKQTRRAHRFAYELLVGRIPEGKQLDHLCRVRHCVNPAHLEPVTNQENVIRGFAARAQAGAEDPVKLARGKAA